MSGQFAEARELVARARRAYLDLGQNALAATYGEAVAADVEVLAGDLAGAERLLRELCGHHEQMRNWSALSTRAADLAEVLFLLGRADDAERWSHDGGDERAGRRHDRAAAVARRPGEGARGSRAARRGRGARRARRSRWRRARTRSTSAPRCGSISRTSSCVRTGRRKRPTRSRRPSACTPRRGTSSRPSRRGASSTGACSAERRKAPGPGLPSCAAWWQGQAPGPPLLASATSGSAAAIRPMTAVVATTTSERVIRRMRFLPSVRSLAPVVGSLKRNRDLCGVFPARSLQSNLESAGEIRLGVFLALSSCFPFSRWAAAWGQSLGDGGVNGARRPGMPCLRAFLERRRRPFGACNGTAIPRGGPGLPPRRRSTARRTVGA